MSMLGSRRARLTTLAVGFAALAAPALAQPASAAVQSCQFVLKSVKAVDTQETATRGDEIIIRLDGERFPSARFVRFPTNNTTRAASAFGSPIKQFADDNPLSVRLLEVDTLLDDPIGTTKNLECTGTQTNQVLVFKETGVDYRMTYDVKLLG
jgi:hypothetical protein